MGSNIIVRNRPFVYTWIVFLLAGLALIAAYPKPAVFLMINTWHSLWLDRLFALITFLGDGWFIILLGVIFFFLRKRPLAFLIISSYLFSGIIVQVMKRAIPTARPGLYFRMHELAYPHFSETLTIYNSASFPSGHTASAFALAASLALCVRKKSPGFLFALLALLTGISRIYLGQHFPEDVLAGMFIGVVSTVLCFLFFNRYFLRWSAKLDGRKPA